MKIRTVICLILALTLLTAASCGKSGSVSTASDAEQRQNDETLPVNSSPSDSSRSYTTQDRQFSVSIKSGKTGKTYTTKTPAISARLSHLLRGATCYLTETGISS